MCWSLKIQIQSCRFESRCACVSISGGSNKWLEVDNLLRCVVGNYWLAMNSGHRWCRYQGKFLFDEYKYFSCSLTNFWSLICCDSNHKKVLIFCKKSWFLILNYQTGSESDWRIKATDQSRSRWQMTMEWFRLTLIMVALRRNHVRWWILITDRAIIRSIDTAPVSDTWMTPSPVSGVQISPRGVHCTGVQVYTYMTHYTYDIYIYDTFTCFRCTDITKSNQEE